MRRRLLTLLSLCAAAAALTACSSDLNTSPPPDTSDASDTSLTGDDSTETDTSENDAQTTSGADTDDADGTDHDATEDAPDSASTDGADSADSVDDADSASDADGDGDGEDTDAVAGVFTLRLEAAHVALPYAEVGGEAPWAEVGVLEVGGVEGVMAAEVEGPFVVEGVGDGGMAGGERRALVVRYAGGMGEAARAAGVLRVGGGEGGGEVQLAVVVGRAGLGVVAWEREVGGWKGEVRLPSAPFPHPSGPWVDDRVWVVVPDGAGWGEAPGVVLHLHGHNALLGVTIPGQYIVEQFLGAGRDALLVIPQGPVQAASGNFGKLQEVGGLSALLMDVVAVAYRDGRLGWGETGEVVVTAHSGGYLATATVVTQGGEPVRGVHLMDALYGRETVFRDFAVGGGTLRSSYTSGGGTDDNNLALRAMLSGAGVAQGDSFHDDDMSQDLVTIGFTPASHSGSVWVERAYARWLTASGLRPGVVGAPELRGVVAQGAGMARVWWRGDVGGSRRVRVEGSWDGEAWEVLGDSLDVELEVPYRPWVRAVYAEGEGVSSDVYGATGADWLVVDGFDRYLGGSYGGYTHDFGARLGQALGEGFSVVSNEAVERGEVSLGDYARVLWLLGDESTADVTFSDAERAAVEAYIAQGGRLIVSGAEVGYASDRAWLTAALGATYVSDDAGASSAGGFVFGEVYPEDFPDVLSGQTTLWTYATGGGAAVGWNNQVIVVGFALETMRQDVLTQALPALTAWLN